MSLEEFWHTLQTVFLEQCNDSTVSMAVVKCLQECSIDNDDVIVFNTDNAAYMKKAYTTALKSLFPNSVHHEPYRMCLSETF